MSDENDNDDLTKLLLRVVDASEETNKLLPQVKKAVAVADQAADVVRSIRKDPREEQEERAKIKDLEKASYNLHILASKLKEAKKLNRLTIAVFVLFFIVGASFLTNEIIRFINPYFANLTDHETCEMYGGRTTQGTEGSLFCVFLIDGG